MGNHQRSWIWGRHVVRETLEAGRWPIREMLISSQLSAEELQSVAALADKRNVKFERVDPATIERMCRAADHQGYAAQMSAYPYVTENGFFETLSAPHAASLLLILDAIQDPFNFGAILRSAEVLGFDAVVVGSERQCEVNSLVARSSAGAVNHMAIVRVDDLANFTSRLARAGIHIVAATEKGTLRPDQANFRESSALLIGNEGVGIRPELIALASRKVCIPQSGQVGSLNAAVSAGILMYEARRQRSE